MASFLIRCTSCGAENRVPGEKEGVQGHCGSCNAELPPLYVQPRVLTEFGFDKFVESYHGPILAEFWAPW